MKQLGITISLALFLLGSIANPSFAFIQSYEADNNEFVNILLQNNDEDDEGDENEGDKKSSEKGDKECDKKDKAKKADSKECSDKKAKSQCKSKSSPTEN